MSQDAKGHIADHRRGDGAVDYAQEIPVHVIAAMLGIVRGPRTLPLVLGADRWVLQ